MQHWRRLSRNDVVVVAAMGNKPEDSEVPIPGRYPGVVAVGAVDQQGNVAGISVTGPQMVLSAPGVQIPAPGLNGVYGTGDGTSASTALVAGVVALVRAKFPQLSARDVIHRLEATARDRGAPGRDDEYGYGIVDPVAALTADVPLLSESASASGSGGSSAGGSGGGSQRTTVLIAGGLVAVVLLAAAGITVGLIRRR